MALLKRWALGLTAVALLASVGRLIDAHALSGPIKGDEATYIAMALSLAEDGDLHYEREDYTRFVGLFGKGPSGIFLKRRYTVGFSGGTPIPSDESLAFGKALIYPAAAAPFAWVGGLGGLVVFNWLMLASCVWAGMRFGRFAAGHPGGAIYGLAFIVASVVPVFAAWFTSEIFNFWLIFWAYFAWLFKKVAPPDRVGWLGGQWTTYAAAALIGMATFSKATNAALIGPILLDAIVARQWKALATSTLAFVLATTGLFGVNALVTGEANYQGAADASSRRSFYDRYPFDDQGTRFDGTGTAMVTNDADAGRVLSPHILEQLPLNIGYFLVGRHAGLVPYYLPGLVIGVMWLVAWRRSRLWQWSSAAAVAGSSLVLIVMLPDSWNGGGGPPGNRYFLSLYPPLLFLLPSGARIVPALATVAAGWAFIGAMLLRPYTASAEPWRNVERPPLKYLPIEITLLLDLPYRLNPLRGPILFVREPTVQVIYMDANTYSAEGQGFWVAGAATAEIIVRTERPLRRVDITFESTIANRVSGSFAGQPYTAQLPPGGKSLVQFARPQSVRYLHSHTYILRVSTTDGFVPAQRVAGSSDTRNLGVFVRPAFVYDTSDDTPQP